MYFLFFLSNIIHLPIVLSLYYHSPPLSSLSYTASFLSCSRCHDFLDHLLSLLSEVSFPSIIIIIVFIILKVTISSQCYLDVYLVPLANLILYWLLFVVSFGELCYESWRNTLRTFCLPCVLLRLHFSCRSCYRVLCSIRGEQSDSNSVNEQEKFCEIGRKTKKKK